CCGIVAGTKILGAVAAPCIGLLVVVSRSMPFDGHEFRRSLRDVLLWVALPAFALVLPWYIRSFVYTGNPLYPLLYRVFGGPDWSLVLDRQFMSWQQSIGMGRTAIDYLLLPLRVVLDGGSGYTHFDGRLNPFWIVLIPLSLAAAPA